MNEALVTFLPSSTPFEVAQKMKEHRVGSVLVVEEGWKLKGIVTDRDVAIAVAADSKDPKTTFAYEIMTADPICISADADFDSALRIVNQAAPSHGKRQGSGSLIFSGCGKKIKDEFQQFIGLEEAFAKHCC
jgi:CBS domain-containing protein